MKIVGSSTTVTGELDMAVEIRFTPNGRAVAVFDLYDDSDNTESVRCEIWGEEAERLADVYPAIGTRMKLSGSYRSHRGRQIFVAKAFEFIVREG